MSVLADNKSASLGASSGPSANGYRKMALLSAKILLSLGLLWFVLQRIDFVEAEARLAKFDLALLLPIAGIFAGHIVLSGVRWQAIASIYPAHANLRWFVEESAIAYSFNQIMLGTVGGDLYRLIRMQRQGYRFSDGVAIIAVERITILVLLALIVLATMPVLYAISGEIVFAWVTLGGITAIPVAVAMAYIVATGTTWERIVRSPRLIRILRVLAQTFLTALRLPVASGSTFAILTTSVLIYWFAARGLGFDTPLWTYLLVAPSAIFISMLPITVGGWGARELAFGLLLPLVGGAYTEGVVVSGMVGLLMIGIGLPGFCALLFHRYLLQEHTPGDTACELECDLAGIGHRNAKIQAITD
jgi:uncharacterized membrane protein YbhN (UPF0104 family)